MPHKGIVLNSDIVFTSIGIVNCTKKINSQNSCYFCLRCVLMQ